MADRQRLAVAAEEHFLVRDQPGSRTLWIGTFVGPPASAMRARGQLAPCRWARRASRRDAVRRSPRAASRAPLRAASRIISTAPTEKFGISIAADAALRRIRRRTRRRRRRSSRSRRSPANCRGRRAAARRRPRPDTPCSRRRRPSRRHVATDRRTGRLRAAAYRRSTRRRAGRPRGPDRAADNQIVRRNDRGGRNAPEPAERAGNADAHRTRLALRGRI